MRSLLFVPADSERKLARSGDFGADVLILDLEDSLAPDRKPEGRRMALEFLRARAAGTVAYVRINPLTSGMALADLSAVMAGAPDGIVFPKCRSAEDVTVLGHYLTALEAREELEQGRTRILPIVTEVAEALFTLGSYAACGPRLVAMTWGAEDLAADIGASTNRAPDGRYDDPYRLARSLTLLAANAAGVLPLDTVFVDFRDEAGLAAECQAARQAGFLGKIAIHPGQVATINAAFSVTAEELAWAKKVVAAFAAKPSAGVVGLDGIMLDRPHLTQAEKLIARAAEAKAE